MYIYKVDEKLDLDGDLPIKLDDDSVIHIRERDLIEIVSAFGYGLYKPPIQR